MNTPAVAPRAVPASAPLIAWADTETNGLLFGPKRATKMHSLGIILSDGRIYSCADQAGYDGRRSQVLLPSGRVLDDVFHVPNERGLHILATADIRVGHNWQDFDERIIRRFYPKWAPKPGSSVLDTLLISRLLYPEISRLGPNTMRLPPRLRMAHSLEALGLRIGEPKNTDFDAGDWQTWSSEMQLYMLQDVLTLRKIFYYLMSQKPAQLAVAHEHEFASIIRRQEAWGCTFDQNEALALTSVLQALEAQLEDSLVTKYGEWWEPSKPVVVTGTRNVKLTQFPDIVQDRISPKTGKPLKSYVGPPLCNYEEGATYTPIKRVVFAPSSREHVRKMLEQRHGWVPSKYTKATKRYPNGQPQVDDSVLRELPYPEAAQLADYYVVMKIRGYLSNGQKAWLRLAELEQDGTYRLHGTINTNGAISGRCTHRNPNLGQVPAISKDSNSQPIMGLEGGFGYECRELFVARPGYIFVGHDGSGLEYCMLAHYLAKWDGGEFIRAVTENDPHEWLRDTVGTDIMGAGDEGRAKMKTAGYAYIYGAGDPKLGSIVDPYAKESERRKTGTAIRERLETRLAIGKLQDAIKENISHTGYLVGLDGRHLHARKAHGALNILLQGAGAVVMKRSLILLDKALQAEGLIPGINNAGLPHQNPDYEFCLNVHDEAQADVKPSVKDIYLRHAVESVKAAGEALNLRCPLRAEAKEGANWKDTH